jgi:hypothetical protein
VTISPGDPGPVDPEAGGTPVPPYGGRRESADLGGEDAEEAATGPAHHPGTGRGQDQGG